MKNMRLLSLGTVLLVLLGGAQIALADPAITISGPISDDILTEGATYVIDWQSADISQDATFNVTIVRSDGATKHLAFDLPSSQTSLAWSVSSDGFAFGMSPFSRTLAFLSGAHVAHAASPNTYQVEITAIENGTTIAYDESGEFSIEPSALADAQASVIASGDANQASLLDQINWLIAQISLLEQELLDLQQQ